MNTEDGTQALTERRNDGILWYIQVYGDAYELPTVLSQINEHSEKYDRVFVQSDGDNDPMIAQICQQFGVPYDYGEQLFLAKKGGAVMQRLINILAGEQQQYVIKVDPDSAIHKRPLLPAPGQEVVMGKIQHAGVGDDRRVSVQGGGILITRAAAERMHEVDIFADPHLGPHDYEWAVSPMLRRRAQSGLASHDWLIGWACHKLNIPVRSHPQFFCEWKGFSWGILFSSNVAVSHPRITGSNVAPLALKTILRTGKRALRGSYRWLKGVVKNA